MLDGCALGDAGVASVARLLGPSSAVPLAALHLGQNGIEGPGCIAIAEALPNNATLRALHLDLNDAIESGAWLVLFHALATKHVMGAGLQARPSRRPAARLDRSSLLVVGG